LNIPSICTPRLAIAMALVLCLPKQEMCRLPDLQRNAAKAWADMDDTPLACMGTPGPWTEYPADFKVWPDTPTPMDAQPLPLPMLHQLPITQVPECTVGPVCIPNETPYAALSQALPGQMSAPIVAGSRGIQLFSGYEADLTLHNVSESAVVQVSQPWQCEFDDWNNAAVGSSYISDVQWPNFSLPHHVAAPEQLQPLGQLQNSFEERAMWEAESNDLPQETAAIAESEVDQHAAGLCRPCAWYWRATGCQNGSACSYCHLCPEGELKSRKKNKIAAMKMGALTPVPQKPSATATSGWGLKLDSLLTDQP